VRLPGSAKGLTQSASGLNLLPQDFAVQTFVLGVNEKVAERDDADRASAG
jgi:hypothetical protein